MGKSNVKILVVDDDSDIRRSIKALLNSKGFSEVDIAIGPMEGLETVTTNPYDLIILDMIMPRFSGWDFLDHLRERNVATRVIVVSAVGLPMVVADTLSKKYRCVDFVQKTQIVENLEAAINTSLDRPAGIV